MGLGVFHIVLNFGDYSAPLVEIDQECKGGVPDQEQAINGNASSKSQDFRNDDDSNLDDGYEFTSLCFEP